MASSRRRFLALSAAGAVAPLLAAPVAARATGSHQGTSLRRAADDQVVITCAGDFFLTHALAPADRAAAEVFQTLASSDLALANLENGLSTTGSPELGAFRHGAALRGHPSLVLDIRRAGVGAVSLANNHTGNFGRDALLETISTLDAAGIPHAGAGRTVDQAFAPVLLTARGRRVALLSVYSYYYNFEADDVADAARAGIARCRAYDVVLDVPGGFDTADRDTSPYTITPAVNPGQVVMASLKEDVDRLADAIRQARAQADLVILYTHIHWGRHGCLDLPSQQRVLARAAIDAGADLFIGHGPHVVRGLEMYRGKPIAYSLGNFVLRKASAPAAPAARPLTRDGALLRVAFSPTRPVAVELLPIVIDYDGLPRFPSQAEGEGLTRRHMALSAALGTELAMEAGHAVLAA